MDQKQIFRVYAPKIRQPSPIQIQDGNVLISENSHHQHNDSQGMHK